MAFAKQKYAYIKWNDFRAIVQKLLALKYAQFVAIYNTAS